jgi:hypothetical protein
VEVSINCFEFSLEILRYSLTRFDTSCNTDFAYGHTKLYKLSNDTEVLPSPCGIEAFDRQGLSQWDITRKKCEVYWRLYWRFYRNSVAGA